jgi:hypothetical protein
MADEPLPLSTVPPIPAEDDYDAICAALRQTVGGRRFLEEYARRSRNGDASAPHAIIQVSNGAIQGVPNSHPQMNVFVLAERLQDLAWIMRERALDQRICEQMEALGAAILSASSLRDPGRLQKLSEALGHLEQRVQRMIEGMAGRAETPHTNEVATKPEPGDFLLERPPILSGAATPAQPFTRARPEGRIVDMDEELFAVPSGASGKPVQPGEVGSSPPQRTPSKMRSDVLAALNAMSDEEKIALFT